MVAKEDGLKSYTIGMFLIAQEAIFAASYPPQESLSYILQFAEESFDFDGEVESIGLTLGPPETNRRARLDLFDSPSDVISSIAGKGIEPKSVGSFQLTLHANGRKDMIPSSRS